MSVPQEPSAKSGGRPRVVIVGAGFGGLSAAQALAKAPVEVTVIDRRNYHLFQPLLYQVATAGLSPAEIAWPIRGILRNQSNAVVQLGRITAVDKDRREVIVGDRRLGYDYLVLATGARHAYFDHPEWEGVAPGLKKIADATQIRESILLAFERAEKEDCDEDERRRLLTFVIVGGGPTGV
jgi:NADH dehydrogenase